MFDCFFFQQRPSYFNNSNIQHTGQNIGQFHSSGHVQANPAAEVHTQPAPESASLSRHFGSYVHSMNTQIAMAEMNRAFEDAAVGPSD